MTRGRNPPRFFVRPDKYWMITLNEDQIPAEKILKDPLAYFILLFGATGGGKTFLIAKNVLDRAEAAAGSRHLVLRSTAIDCKSIVFNQTFKDVVNAKYWNPNLGEQTAWDFMREKLDITTEPMCIKLPNGSQIDFKGLDNNNIDRILGSDYSTIFISEASLIEDYTLISTLETRLRQRVMTINGKPLRMKFIMDCNPPSKRHWTYPVFYEGLNYDTRQPHDDQRAYQAYKIETVANRENLADGYVDRLTSAYKGDYIRRKRFLEGMWYDEVENPLFSGNDIQRNRLSPVMPDHIELENFIRIIVAVDPAITSHKGSDETGIIVLGEDEDHEFHVLDDLSGKYQPAEWGAVAINALKLWRGNEIIAERNQGGDMVAATISTIDRNVKITTIHASRGKDIRAEGASTAMKNGRIHMRGNFQQLEDQLVEFEIGFNRRKKGYSPDRLDGFVHGINHLLGESPKMGGSSSPLRLF